MKRAERIIASLGTLCRITVFTSSDAGSADDDRVLRFLDDAEEYIKKLDDLFSIFKENSEISALNKNAGNGPLKVSEETLSVLEEAIISSELSDGAFDVTASLSKADSGPDLILPYDKAGGDGIVMSSAGSAEDIVLDRLAMTAEIKTKGTSIDLGGIAKGFAVDRLREMAEDAGIDDVLIDLGGTVLSLGEERNIGIRDPFRPLGDKNNSNAAASKDEQKNLPDDKGVVMTIRSRDEVICTSGTYERGEHIIDPGTGKPAETRVLSATVIGQNGAQADALATAAMVLGVDKSVEMLGSAGVEAVFILKDGSVFATGGLGERISLTGGHA